MAPSQFQTWLEFEVIQLRSATTAAAFIGNIAIVIRDLINSCYTIKAMSL